MWIQMTRAADNEEIMVNTNQVLVFGPPVRTPETPINARTEILTSAGVAFYLTEPPSFIRTTLQEYAENARRSNS